MAETKSNVFQHVEVVEVHVCGFMTVENKLMINITSYVISVKDSAFFNVFLFF